MTADARAITSKMFPVLASADEVTRRGDAARAAGRGGIPGVEFGSAHRIVFVIEDGETLTWVDSALMDTIQATNDPMRLACDNLRARTATPLVRRAVAEGRNVWFVGHDDGLDSGRLLLHDLWAPLKATLPGELLVRVPMRGVVLCCTNIAEDMTFVDAVAEHILAKAKAGGFTPVESPWLVWTDVGWGEPGF